MVYGAAKAYHGILSGLQREIITVSRKLPYRLYQRDEIRKLAGSGRRINGNPRIRTCRIIWRQGSETEAVEILDLEMVVMQDEVLV